MRKIFKSVTVATILTIWAQHAAAIITTTVPLSWSVGDGGGLASNCIYTVVNQKPLSIPKTIIADNSTPNGTILHSWDYADFGSISFNCPTATILTTNAKGTVPVIRSGIQLYYYGLNITSEYGSTILTNNSGIRIKLYFKLTEKSEYDSGYYSTKTTIFNKQGGFPMPIGAEYPLSTDNSSSHVMYTVMNSATTGPDSSNNYTHELSSLKNSYAYTIRGEIIKIGNIATSTSLSFTNAGYLRHFGSSNSIGDIPYTELFGSGGITFVKPSCRLRGGTDYTVNLGQWVDNQGRSNAGALPATGSPQLLDINLECNGAANVDFNFQDTGSTASSNSNISVYDSIGGQLIEGLEVEMLYNGSRFNVRKPSENVTNGKIDVGIHGSYNGTPTNPSNYNSQSQAQFGARFIQRSAIKRNGVAYTGPVTGKVNMFVTYH